MKFEAETKALLRAVTASSKVIAGRNVIPVLECLLLRAEDNTLRLTGTDMDAEIAATCEAAVSAPGALAVHAEDLRRFLASLPAGSLTHASIEDDRLLLRAGRATASISTLPAADFPTFPVDAAPHEVSGATEAFGFCAPYASHEEARYYLRGVYFSPDGTVSTDGHRLGATPVTSEVAAIVPINMAKVIRPLLDAGGRLFLGERVWRVEAEGVTAMGKLIDGTFPDWKRVVPAQLPIFTADADDILSALRTATLDGVADRAFLASGDGAVSISGEGHQRASAEADFRAEIAVAFAMCINAKYLQSVLAPFSGSVIEVFGADGTLGFRAVGRPEWLTVCIGMRHDKAVWPSAQRAAA